MNRILYCGLWWYNEGGTDGQTDGWTDGQTDGTKIPYGQNGLRVIKTESDQINLACFTTHCLVSVSVSDGFVLVALIAGFVLVVLTALC